MLKKSVASLLIVLYTSTVMGFALNVHYCGNIRLSVKVNTVPASCGMDKLAGKMKCCKDNRIDVKVKDSHQSVSTSFLAKITLVEVPKFINEDFLFSPQQTTASQLADRAPPDPVESNGISVFLKYCNLRI
jgi:hypothetical protein